MAKSPDAFRTISEVSEWLDTPAHVLRFWESKFTQVKPVKRAGGRRYYRPEDMALLGGIKTLLHDEGMTIKGVQKLLREKGVRHVMSLGPPLDDRDDIEGQAIAEPAPAETAPYPRLVAEAEAAPQPPAEPEFIAEPEPEAVQPSDFETHGAPTVEPEDAGDDASEDLEDADQSEAASASSTATSDWLSDLTKKTRGILDQPTADAEEAVPEDPPATEPVAEAARGPDKEPSAAPPPPLVQTPRDRSPRQSQPGLLGPLMAARRPALRAKRAALVPLVARLSEVHSRLADNHR